jgi:mono/diheme cytochrome c family protein
MLALTGILAGAAYVTGHDIITTNLTYSRDISRIFAIHCSACHGTGSSIPLTTYQEVRPWAVGIKEQVLSRSMPPWGAAKGFGELSPDHGLSQEDMMIIAAWVIGGAPEGNPQMLPKGTPQTVSAEPLQLEDALTIVNKGELQTPLQMVGIRPLANSEVSSARLIARLPDGRIQPLLWLYHFDPKSIQAESPAAFTFRNPLDLPRGTIVESSAPLRFALEISVAQRARLRAAR